MKVHEMLDSKDGRVVTTHPGESVAGVASLLAAKRIGALPVVEGRDRLVGIISERDVIRGLAEHGAKLGALTVQDLMTREVVSCRPADSARQVMELMARNRIRHLPVVEEGELRGILSLRDLMEAQLKEARLEVNVLRDYARAKG